MERNSIGDDGAKAIAEALKVNVTLTDIKSVPSLSTSLIHSQSMMGAAPVCVLVLLLFDTRYHCFVCGPTPH